MLRALLQGKLDAEFARAPHTIEDLVTATVIGTCSYLPPRSALVPFLSQARATSDALLEPALADVIACEVELWPQWEACPPGESRGRVLPGADGGEPDVVVTFRHEGGRRSMLVVEAKVFAGKSSLPSTSVGVSDQLGKYWVHLVRYPVHRARP